VKEIVPKGLSRQVSADLLSSDAAGELDVAQLLTLDGFGAVYP